MQQTRFLLFMSFFFFCVFLFILFIQKLAIQ